MTPEEKKIHDMTTKLAKRKEEISELRGEKNTLLKQLKDEGCDSVEAGEKMAKAEQAKADKLRAKLTEGIAELESKYEW